MRYNDGWRLAPMQVTCINFALTTVRYVDEWRLAPIQVT